MKIKIYTIITIFFSIATFMPDYLASATPTMYIHRVAYYSYILLMALEFLGNPRIEKKAFLCCSAYYGCLFISTLCYSGFEIQLMKSLIKTAAFTILTINFLAINKRRIFGLLLRLAATFGEIGSIANLIAIMLIPEGIYKTIVTGEKYWLYGHKNTLLIAFFIPILASAVLYYNHQRGRIAIRTFLLLIVIAISSAISAASTSLLLTVLLILMFMVMGLQDVKKIFTMRIAILGSLLVNVAIVFFQAQEILDFIIVGLFQKDLSLSSRTLIWAQALAIFAENMLLGIGYLFSWSYYSLITLGTTHNIIVGVLFHLGLVGVVFWGFFFVAFTKKTQRFSNQFYMQVATVIVSVFLLHGVTENTVLPAGELKAFVLLTLVWFFPNYFENRFQMPVLGD